MTANQVPLLRRGALVALVPVALTVSACGANPPPGTELNSVNLAIEHMLLEESVAESQSEVLRNAQAEDRDITQEEYRQGYESFSECVSDAGITVVEIAEFGEPGGGVSFSLTVSARAEDEDETFQLYGDCFTRTVGFIEMAWLMRAEAIEAQDFLLAQFQSAMRECVAGLGAQVHDGMQHIDLIELERLHRGEDAPYEETCMVTTGLHDALEGG